MRATRKKRNYERNEANEGRVKRESPTAVPRFSKKDHDRQFQYLSRTSSAPNDKMAFPN